MFSTFSSQKNNHSHPITFVYN